MKNNFCIKQITALFLLFASINHVYAHADVKISEGYIKANIPGSDVTAAYMQIINNSDNAITLEKVTGTISNQIEIHEHSMADGMMKMRQVDNITINANSSITLKPSGLHLMIFSLKQELSKKETVTLTMHFSNKMEVNIQLPVYQYK
jgi:hypothetical protein